jgi:hypothetical protein
MSSRDTDATKGLIDWDAPPKSRGNGNCKYSGCSEPTHAFVAVTVRLKGSKLDPANGTGRMLTSRQRGFCKEHAELIYALLLKELPL